MRLPSHQTLIFRSLAAVLLALGVTAVQESGAEAPGRGRTLRTRVRTPPGKGAAEGAPLRLLDLPLVQPNGRGLTPVLATLDGQHRGAVPVPVPSRFRVAVTVPEGGRLTFGLDLHGVPPVPRLFDFQVRVLQGGETEVRFSHSRACYELGWSQHAVDLADLAGQEIELEFLVRGRQQAGRVAGARALWGEPVLGGDASPTRPDVLFLVVDSLRADALGCYGSTQPTTPALDRLAADSMVFERVITTSPCAMPAALTLLTGRYPSDVWPLDWSERRRSLGLRAGVPTLAGVLRDHGYFTVGISDQVQLDGLRFGRGFDVFVDLPLARPGRAVASPLTRFWNRLRGTLSDLPEGGLFTYLHLVFPSPPHASPAHYRDLFQPGTPSADASEAQRSSLRRRARYEAEVRFTDDWVSLILELFDELGRTPDVVVVAGSFGLGFAEHRSLTGAGNSLYNELLHVPLILHAPGRVEPGRCPSLVSTADVVPTVLDLVGIDGGTFAGRTVLPLVSGEEPDERLAYSEFPAAPSTSGRAIQNSQWKLILPSRESTVFQVFRMDTDPGEQAALDPSHPETEEVKDRLWDEVLRVVRGATRFREKLAPPRGESD